MQLYLSFRPLSSVAKDHHAVQQSLCLSAAIANVLAWLISLKLQFNSSETEFIVIGTRQQRFKVDISSLCLV